MPGYNDNFDKYLLSFFLLMLLGLHVYLAVHHMDDQWTAHVFDNFQGALLGLITGVAVGKRLVNGANNGNGNGNGGLTPPVNPSH